MNELLPMTLRSNTLSLPFAENLTPTSYELPQGLTAEQWLDVGRALGRARGSLMWWVGDWWAFGEHAYGDRANAVKAEDWEGPAFQTCMDAAWVCRRFETSSRDEVVSFRSHRAIAPIPDDGWRLKVLTWAATIGEGGKRPARAAIEEKVRQVKAQLAQGWTEDQLDRRGRAEKGECVVANIREEDGRRVDEALLSWAEAEDRFARIDRKTEWGNPFEIPDDGDRETVIGKFERFYWPFKNGLLGKVPKLRGKVLGCWCHPDPCHGHIIAETVNREAKGEGSATEIAERIAEHEG